MIASDWDLVRSHFTPLLLSCALSLPLSSACSDDDTEDHESTAAADGGDATTPGADAGQGALDGLLIELKAGKLQGEMAGEARRFINIPYAKPPLGELRWKAAVPNEPWSGVRHETEFVKGCPQLQDQGAPPSENEDCLYLNVWSPEPAPERAPVMVWIHGGGNFSGGTGIPVPTSQQLWYDGRVFAAKQGVVVVTIQYRLGPLGFFGHPGLEQEGEPVGNQGLWDQRLALQWVRDNIARFGGDPRNVTIFGESAGALDVCYHVASPASRGLFHRAISQSGGCTTGREGAELTLSEIAAQMQAYGKAVGCEAGADQLACMRKVSVRQLMDNSMQPMPGGGGSLSGGQWRFGVIRGGTGGFLPADPLPALFDRGDVAHVPYLLGSNNDEGTTFLISAPTLANEQAYMADLKTRYGDAAEKVAAIYPPAAFQGDVNAARARVIGDGVVCSALDTAQRAAKAGLSVFMYNFNMPWSLSPDRLRAAHGSEMSHVFGVPYLPVPDPQSEEVALAINGYWARFAAEGNPNGPNAPATWPQYKADDDKRLQLDANWSVLENFRTKECTFWRELAAGASAD